MRLTPRSTVALAGTLAAALAVSSCSSSSDEAAASDSEIGALDLSGVCPADVRIQTDWNPESEHGPLYEMLGPDAVIDAAEKSVTAELMSNGEYTGVDVTILAGGPAIGFQSVSSQMYSDTSITLGYASIDEAISVSGETPTTAVFAALEKNPQMIMWDPETYPDVETIAELGETDAVIRYFEGSGYMDFLTGEGILDPANVDASYDGTPANFVAAGGADAQQGFASAEPFIYENEIDAWGKPVAFELIHDAGFPTYEAAVSARSGELEELSDCLTELVPVMQQAEIDYFEDPSTANDLIQELVVEYNTGWVYSPEVADYSVETMLELGIVGNGHDDTLGNFDPERIQTVYDIVMPIFTEQGHAIADGIVPEDLYTNEFIDESIGF